MADKEREIITRCAKDIADICFDDQNLTDNYWFDEFFNEYLSLCFPEFEEAFNFVWDNQKKKKSYGDIDYTLTKVFDREYKEPKRFVESPFKKGDMWDLGSQTHIIKTILYEDHSSCAPHTKFLIQCDENCRNKKYHIRIIYEKSDYKKGNRYVSFPNLKWYKDRGYIIDYIENLHMTTLGGCYGDCRDKGFIATFKKSFGKVDVEKGSMSNFQYYRMVVRSLQGAMCELKENIK